MTKYNIRCSLDGNKAVIGGTILKDRTKENSGANGPKKLSFLS